MEFCILGVELACVRPPVMLWDITEPDRAFAKVGSEVSHVHGSISQPMTVTAEHHSRTVLCMGITIIKIKIKKISCYWEKAEQK